jgi:hypothetical protein
MKKMTLTPKVDENGDYCDDLFLYSVQDRCDCGPFVPAKVLEDCRSQGLPYVCLDIPGLRYNVVIELDEPDRSQS